MSEQQTNWQVFRGDYVQDGDRILQLPPPPPWRQFRTPIDPETELTPEQEAYQAKIADYWQQLQSQAESDEHSRDRQRGKSFRVRKDQANVVQAVNAAMSLRRPLLITGRPGSGKTSLAYAIANELKLGPVLMWPITARTTLDAGLYRYDAIARLQDAQLRKQKAEPKSPNEPDETADREPDKTADRTIGDYIQLGALGTAFLPTP